MEDVHLEPHGIIWTRCVFPLNWEYGQICEAKIFQASGFQTMKGSILREMGSYDCPSLLLGGSFQALEQKRELRWIPGIFLSWGANDRRTGRSESQASKVCMGKYMRRVSCTTRGYPLCTELSNHQHLPIRRPPQMYKPSKRLRRNSP